MTLRIAELASPVGPLVVALAPGPRAPVVALAFADAWPRLRPRLASRTGTDPDSWRAAHSTTDPARRLRDYFAGDLGALDPIDVDLGGTAFQRSVWLALRRIRPGRTAAYADVARFIGNPGAVRAVGLANGANPVCLVVPCHRIVASGGGLGGYGGGLDRKLWLLRHEGAIAHADAGSDRPPSPGKRPVAREKRRAVPSRG